MATFVLVHPACGWCWKKVATILRARGNEVFAPTLTGLGERAHLATEAWHITDQADLRWVLPRLTATPLGHFTEPVRRKNTAAERLPRTYIRCTVFPNPIFDRYADVARSRAGWRHRELAANHLPFITHPDELVGLLLEAVG